VHLFRARLSSAAERLELVGDDDLLVGSAEALPLRLLAEQTGLRAGLSAAMTRRGFTPLYDRGQLLVDLAVTELPGGEAISDFQGLRHLAPVIGPIPSNPTVWRPLNEIGQLQLARINTTVTVFRRHWWGLLAARPEGFPWLKVAGRELTGITVVDLDASIVHACSEKENAQPTYRGGIGSSPHPDNITTRAALHVRPPRIRPVQPRGQPSEHVVAHIAGITAHPPRCPRLAGKQRANCFAERLVLTVRTETDRPDADLPTNDI